MLHNAAAQEGDCEDKGDKRESKEETGGVEGAEVTSGVPASVLHQEVLEALPESAPTRRVVFIAASSTEARRIIVRWNNAERWHKRHLVYSLTLLDEEE